MSDPSSDFYRKKYEARFKSFKDNIQKKVFDLIYSGFIGKGSKFEDKTQIPDKLITYFYELNMELMYGVNISYEKKISDGILLICLMQNFDGKTGYVMFIDPDAPLTENVFINQRYSIGRTRSSYDILKGKIRTPDGKKKNIIHKIIMRNDTTTGITLTDKMKSGQIHDRQKCSCHLGQNDSINVVYDESKMKYSLLVDSCATKSSLEFYKIVEKAKKSGKFTMRSLLSDKSHLMRLYNLVIKNSKRNNGRIAAEMQRFFGVMIKTIDDPYAYIPKNQTCCISKVGISSTIQYENTFGLFNLDRDNYLKYIVGMKSQQKVGLYSKSKSNKHPNCMAYFCGTNYYPFWRKERIHPSSPKVWKTWIRLNDNNQFGLLELPVSKSAERFISIPTSATFIDAKKRREKYREKKRRKRRKRKRKRRKKKLQQQQQSVIIMHDPYCRDRDVIKKFDEESEYIQNDRTERKEDLSYQSNVPFMFVFSKIGNSFTERKRSDVDLDKLNIYKNGDKIDVKTCFPGKVDKVNATLFNSFVSMSIT